MTLVRRSNTRPSLLPLNKKQQVYCPNKKQCRKGAQVSARVGVGMYVRQTPALIGYYYEPGRGAVWHVMAESAEYMLIPVIPESLLTC